MHLKALLLARCEASLQFVGIRKVVLLQFGIISTAPSNLGKLVDWSWLGCVAQRCCIPIPIYGVPMLLSTNADVVCMEGVCLLAAAPPPKTCRFLYVAFGTGLP